MESVVSKIIYLFRLQKLSVAYSATVVKTVFANFLKKFVKQRKMSKLASLFSQNIDFEIRSIPSNGVKNLLRPNDIYKFMTLLLKDYYLILGNGAKNLLLDQIIYVQIYDTITIGLYANPQ